MLVAQLRGAKFKQNSSGEWAPLDSRLDRGLADKALKDVSEWLGFSSVMEYLDELSIWGEKIFLFAKITLRKRKTSDV